MQPDLVTSERAAEIFGDNARIVGRLDDYPDHVLIEQENPFSDTRDLIRVPVHVDHFLPRKERKSAAPTRYRIAFHCPECDRTWTTADDPDEWAYGHDCEAT